MERGGEPTPGAVQADPGGVAGTAEDDADLFDGEFDEFEVTPRTPWNYALAIDHDSPSVKIKTAAVSSIPFDTNANPECTGAVAQPVVTSAQCTETAFLPPGFNSLSHTQLTISGFQLAAQLRLGARRPGLVWLACHGEWRSSFARAGLVTLHSGAPTG